MGMLQAIAPNLHIGKNLACFERGYTPVFFCIKYKATGFEAVRLEVRQPPSSLRDALRRRFPSIAPQRASLLPTALWASYGRR
ncbi:hypothetical protein [Nostoc sp.]|uniref:hypothetical protein n=1 Tax=Nostoc sp. TaxID=1180 RepID=UPI002FFB05DD